MSLPPEERQIGSNPLLKVVVCCFELPAELAPGPYALIVLLLTWEGRRAIRRRQTAHGVGADDD